MHLAAHPTATKENPHGHTSLGHPCFPSRPLTELGKEAGLRTDNLLTAVVLPDQEAGAALALGLRWQGDTTSCGAGSWVSSPRELLAGPSKPGSRAGPSGFCKF